MYLYFTRKSFFSFVCSWSKLAKGSLGSPTEEAQTLPGPVHRHSEAAETSKMNWRLRAYKGREGKSQEVRKVHEEAEGQGEGHCSTIRAYIMFFARCVSFFSVKKRMCMQCLSHANTP